MKVKVIYRNYIPLNTPYYSFLAYPPKGIQFIISKPIPYIKNLFFIYKYFKNNFITKKLIKLFQKLLFDFKKDISSDNIDLLFYISMIPEEPPQIPYIIDLEHVFMLFNGTNPTKKELNKIKDILLNKQCKMIIPLSNAAKISFKDYLGGEFFKQIEQKVEVIYPSLPDFRKIFKKKKDYSIVNMNNNLKILTVGNTPYPKGVVEVLEAFKIVRKKYNNIELYCISNLSNDLKKRYSDEKIHFFRSNVPHDEIIKKFFMRCDLFVLPTHGDTFCMVILEALSCGLPVITTKQFALKEIVKDGFNGYFVKSDNLFLNEKHILPVDYSKKILNYKIIENKLVNDLVSKMVILIENKNLLNKLKLNTIEEFLPEGNFSIETRNKKLKRIFEEALK
jgi:glycosyltransferase involved in cell wall biosynthesis